MDGWVKKGCVGGREGGTSRLWGQSRTRFGSIFHSNAGRPARWLVPIRRCVDSR